SHEWHSVKPNTLGLKVLRTKTPARRPMINNMISISLDGKPCVSEAYSVLFIYNSINLILVRVERKSLIRKTLILIRVPFASGTEKRLSCIGVPVIGSRHLMRLQGHLVLKLVTFVPLLSWQASHQKTTRGNQPKLHPDRVAEFPRGNGRGAC